MSHRKSSYRIVIAILAIISTGAFSVVNASPWSSALEYLGITQGETIQTETATTAFLPPTVKSVCSAGGADFLTIGGATGAVNDANTNFALGNVTYNVCAGHTETITSTIGLVATGSLGNEIIFQKSGAGANPLITAYTGGTGTPGTAVQDGIWKLVGSDYITIDGIDLAENAANVANPATMEYGYALYKAAVTNGAQNNTIKNCTITLNRLNNATGNTIAVDGSRGIDIVNALDTAATTALTVTAASGSNSNNKIYANTIQNVNIGIALIGFADVTPFTLADTNNDIGGAALATGNTIKNFGGAAAAANPSAGIRTLAQYGLNVSYNNVNSNDGGGVNHPSTLRGIYLNTATSASETITNNTVSIKGGGTTSAITAIDNVAGATAAGNTVSINNNTITGSTYTTATSGTFTGISNSASAATVNMNNNILTNNATNATSGTTNMMVNSGAATVAVNMNSNNINGMTFNAATSGTFNGVSSTSSGAAATLSISSNNFQGITYSALSTAANNYVNCSAVPAAFTANTNTFTNLNVNTSGTVTFIVMTYTTSTGTGTKTVNGNSIVTGFNRGGASGSTLLVSDNGSSVTGTLTTVQNNSFTNIVVAGTSTITGINLTDGGTAPTKNITGNTLSGWTAATGAIIGVNITYWNGVSTLSNNTITNLTGQAAITGINMGTTVNTATTVTVANNIINNLTSTGAGGTVIGIGNSNTSTGIAFTSNTINTLSSTGSASVITGINITGGNAAGLTISKNKIYDLSGNQTGSTVNGINFTSGTIFNVSNNLIGDLRATTATGLNAINGINASATATYNIFYNSIYLNATSTSLTTFGSSVITFSSTATSLNLRNNNLVNLSTPAQDGLNTAANGIAAVLRRSGGTAAVVPANYNTASNNNNHWVNPTAGTNTHTTYVEGTATITNSMNTVAQMKTFMGNRDQSSVGENPPFLSTTGSSAQFLHINTTIATQLESGAGTGTGIADDYDLDARSVTTPDIGADEFAGIAADLTGPTITYTAFGNTGSVADRTLNPTFTDASGVPTTAPNRPRIYFKKSTDAAYVSRPCTFSVGTWTCTTLYAGLASAPVIAGDIINYFVIAQDNAGNVSANPGGGLVAADVNTVTTPPTTPNSYTILPSISGNKSVGSGGDYATLTAAVAALNSAELTGPVTLSLTDPSYSALETFPIVINANSGSSAANTVTIKPAVGISPTISGSSAGCVIAFNGADYMTIDGSNAVMGTTRNLTITNTNTGTSSAVVCIQSTASSDGATNDVVKNTNIVGQANTTTLFGVFSGGQTVSTSSLGAGNNNNTIQNNNITTAQNGIFSQGASAASKNTGNIITQNLINSASPANISKNGIQVGFENNIQVSLNNVSGMVQTSSPDVFGITLGISGLSTSGFTGNEVTNATVSRNIVGSVRNTGTFSACGICVAPATSGSNLIVNNFVSGVSANGTGGDFGVGILVGGGAGSTTQIYFNSVSMTGTQTGGSDKSYALAVGGADPVVDIRNNALYNTQNNGTGINYAIGFGYSTFVNLTSNYNDLFVTSPSAIHLVGGTGSISAPTAQATLANLQTATGKDANSLTADPLFTSLTDLHLTSGSTLINNGITAGAVAIDIDGDPRPSGGGFDIGADEVFVPAVPGTLQFSSVTYGGNEGTTATVTVTRTAGNAGAVSVNYATSDGSATGSVACVGAADYVSASGTLNWADMDTASKTFTVPLCTDAILDPAETVNLTLSVPTGGATIGANNPAVLTITDIPPPVSGTFTVGTGGSFTSLTNPGGIFESLNNGGLNGNVTINIISDLTGETGTVALNQLAEFGAGAGTYTVTIKPSGAARSITGTGAGAVVININGADRVTIDGSLSGGTDRSLTINNTNTATGTAALRIGSIGAAAGSTNDTVKNCIIQAGTVGSTSITTFGIFVGDTTGAANGADNDNLTIQNNQILKALIGMQVIGGATAGQQNDNLLIDGNIIGDAVTANSIGRIGMNVGQATTATIRRNMITNVITTDSAITSSNNGRGIIISTGVTNSRVTRNNVSGVRYTSTAGYAGKGIDINTGSATSNLTVDNNFVSDIGGDGWSDASTDGIAGIRILGTTGGINLYYNSVNLFGTFAGNTSGTQSAAFYFASTVTGLDVRNNIFVSTLDNSATVSDKTYAIATTATSNAPFTTINNNDYYVTGTPGFVGLLNAVDRLDLTAWRTASGQDLLSVSGDPLFASSTNLHLTPASSFLFDAGVAIPGIDWDYDGQIRTIIGLTGGIPAIGGDEFLVPVAAAVSISGRVTTAGGNGVRNAIISIQGGSLPSPVFVRTGSLGYYTVENLDAGETYIVTVNSKRFIFQVPTRVISLTDSVSDIDFVADPQ